MQVPERLLRQRAEEGDLVACSTSRMVDWT